MSGSALSAQIENALANTAPGSALGWKGSEPASIRRKAGDAIAAITDRGWEVGRTGFLDVGGADGALVDHLLSTTDSTRGIVLEYDDAAGQAAFVRSGKFTGAKRMEVLTGDANQKIERAVARLSQWRDEGHIDQMCVTLYAVLHELSDRGSGAEDLVAFLSRLVWRMPAVVIAREPCVPSDLPAEVLLANRDCPPKLVARLAERIRSAHPIAFPKPPQALTGSVRLDGRLAIETVTKMFYIEDFQYELEERVTSLTSAELVNSFNRVFGDAHVRHENLQSVSFDEKWKALDLQLSDLRGHRLAKPQLHVKITAYHAASDAPDAPDATAPSPPVSPRAAQLPRRPSSQPDTGHDAGRSESLAERFFSENYVSNGPEFKARLARAISVDMLGYSHNRMAVTYSHELAATLGRGGAVRVLAIDPASDAVFSANARSSTPKNPAAARHQHEAACAQLLAISQFATAPGTFQMRLIDCIPPFTLYMFDLGTIDAELFVWMTPWRAPSVQRPGFRLSARTDEKWFAFFAAQFESMWTSFQDRTLLGDVS